METKNEEKVEVEAEEEADTELEPQEETINWEARAKELEEKAIASRERSKALRKERDELRRAVEVSAKVSSRPTEEPKLSGLDEVQLDYLDLKGITEAEDIELIQKVMERTGQSLRDTLKDDYITTKLKDNQVKREVQAATPSSTRRSGQAPLDNEDFYWKKYEQTGELPKYISHDMKVRLVRRKESQYDPRQNPFD